MGHQVLAIASRTLLKRKTEVERLEGSDIEVSRKKHKYGKKGVWGFWTGHTRLSFGRTNLKGGVTRDAILGHGPRA